MTELNALKDKHIQVSVSQLKVLMEKHIESVKHIRKEQDQRFNENDTKLKELTTKLNAMKETLYCENEALDNKNNDLSNQIEIVKELETERNKFLQENQSLEVQRNNIKMPKPNLNDQKLIELGRKKLKFYKDLTRIRWNYDALKEQIKGYVSDKKEYIHHFCYEIDENKKKLNHLLWDEIRRSTVHRKEDDEYGKENIMVNE